MADDDLKTLMNARAALDRKRLTWAQTIAAPGEISEGAIRAIIEVQEAINAIDELEAAEEEEDDEE